MTLEGKVIAVLGASSGIGEGIAREALKYSPRGIVLGARTVNKLEKIADYIRNKGVDVLVIPTDVLAPSENQNSFTNFLRLTIERYGRLDILISSAGVLQEEKPTEKLTREEIEKIVSTNYLQVAYSAPEIAGLFKQQKAGIYVIISSHAGSKHFPFEMAYNSSKAGASSVVATLDNEFSELRKEADKRKEKMPLWAIALEPGFTDTEEAKRVFKKYRKEIESSQTPEQFAQLVIEYILNPEQKYEANNRSPIYLLSKD